MTRDEIAAVMDRVPNLGAHGIGIFDSHLKRTRWEWTAAMDAERECLLSSEDDCSRVQRWLVGLEPVQTPNFSSYYLKHLAEKNIGYVTNGAFIAAAIHSGFPYRVIPLSANVDIGVSRMSLRRKIRPWPTPERVSQCF
jgi:hypothetical protein